MAMITCPECGGQVSDRAAVCVHCGCPMEYIKKMSYDQNDLYKVVLTKEIENYTFTRNEMIYCIGCDGVEAYRLMDAAPVQLLQGLSLDDALKVQNIFEKIGTKIELEVDTESKTRTEWHYQVSNPANQTATPKCPTCGSTNIERIGAVERGASVFTLGLFSKKINKTFKCNHCGYTW